MQDEPRNGMQIRGDRNREIREKNANANAKNANAKNEDAKNSEFAVRMTFVFAFFAFFVGADK